MTLGRRRQEQQDTFWVAADQLGSGPRNAFYDRLNQLLTEIDFDRKLEQAAEPFYQSTGRKSLPPGIYFRMIFIGDFEDISSQRGIAWRCEDSRSLARFLGYGPGESTPITVRFRSHASGCRWNFTRWLSLPPRTTGCSAERQLASMRLTWKQTLR